MNIQTMSPNQIRRVGLGALVKTLGPVGMARFLQQFETGAGDYTRERAQWQEKMDVRQVVKEIKQRRKRK